jgi:hypothetical protein
MAREILKCETIPTSCSKSHKSVFERNILRPASTIAELQIKIATLQAHNKVILERFSRAAELLSKLSRRRISNEGREKELLSVLLLLRKANPPREDVLS